MNLLEKSDDEIIAISKPIWDNLVKTSNMKDYGGFYIGDVVTLEKERVQII